MYKILIICLLLIFSFFTNDKIANAYGECDDYGVMAMYSSYNNKCTCMSGYSFGTDFMGRTSCISDTQLCTDKYGYNATSDFSGNCKCRYGYALGKDSIGRTQCVSLDSMCYDQLGYSSRYDSLSDSCKCSYGYIIRGGKCVSGTSYCSSTHGLYSSYNNSDNKCECDSGYTLDDANQCVKKQNNVYFTVKELDTDEKTAIIKSDYDYKYYLISYGSGCYSSSFNRYLNHKIVINLGTDFDLDTWDKIVLQDDNETCNITRKERADYSTTLKPEPQKTSVTNSPLIYSPTPPTITIPKENMVTTTKSNKDFEVKDSEVSILKGIGTLSKPTAFRKCPSVECSLIRYYAETSELKITGVFGDWYRIDGTTDAGGSGQMISGWVIKTSFGKMIPDNSSITSQSSTSASETKVIKKNWFIRFLNWFK
jgi:hypothetical protein